MRLALALILPLAACVADDGPAPYAFVGTWDCGDKTLTLTNTRYSDGSATTPILAVAPDGQSYTLTLANRSLIALAAVTDTGLTWVEGNSGAQRNCRRVN